MIQTKLFLTTKKDIFIKPSPVPIKHKTYRQLLGLDRPKKQIFVQSDNQNDDFLQKLLKEQQKEKKKKNNHKKVHIKSKQSKPSSTSKQSSQKKPGPKIGTFQQQLQRQKQANRANQSNKLNQTKNQQNDDSKQLTLSKSCSNKKYIKVQDYWKSLQQLKNTYKEQNNSSRRGFSASSLSNRNNKSNTISNNAIQIDQSDSTPFVVTSSMKTKSHLAMKSDGFKLLQQNKKKQNKQKLTISAKINPQLHEIIHQFNRENIYPKFKAKTLSIKQFLAMTKTTFQYGSCKNSLNNEVGEKNFKNKLLRNKLFKNSEQEERFMKNLIQMKQKKYQMPTLL